MSKTFRPYEPRQGYLLAPSPMDWLPEDHLAYFILDVIGELDLKPIFAHYERELRGYPPHHPRMMLALLLYGYCVGVCSSRQIERRTREDIAFRLLSGDEQPDHTCISEFRRIHLNSLSALFVQVLRLCQKAGLVKLGHVSLDGTKMKANASKHKAMSYQRMQDEQARLSKLVEELLTRAEQTDRQEDVSYGIGKRGDELPEELRRAKSRLARIRKAKQELEAEATQTHARSDKEDDDADDDSSGSASGGGSALPAHRIPTVADGTPTAKAQRNFTDADSRIMKTGDGFVQGYNAQVVVDDAAQVIVAQAVTNQPPDAEHFVPMLERMIANCGAAPRRTSADNGYFSEANVAAAIERGIDPYIAAGRTKHGEPKPIVRGRPRADMTPKQRMARKLATRSGAAVYARRKAIVEPVFGQIKQARGLRTFLLRGVPNVRGEWALMCVGHNLLKLHAARTAR
jgi:transposase